MSKFETVVLHKLVSCEVCQERIASFDGGTKYGSEWISMCDRCFADHGIGIGFGLGRRIEYQVPENA